MDQELTPGGIYSSHGYTLRALMVQTIMVEPRRCKMWLQWNGMKIPKVSVQN